MKLVSKDTPKVAPTAFTIKVTTEELQLIHRCLGRTSNASRERNGFYNCHDLYWDINRLLKSHNLVKEAFWKE